MPIPISIEVAVKTGVSTTERGSLLEHFARRLLETQNYSVTEQVRLTGVEVDLYAKDNTTSEIIYVECKAYRSPLSSEVIMKLKGQVAFKDVSSGWLVSTGELSKDAKGLMAEWSDWPPEKKRKLQLYDPISLSRRLILAKLVIDPENINLPNKMPAESALLLVTKIGEFWVLNERRAEHLKSHVFEANTGNPIIDQEILSHLKSTDTSASNNLWQPNSSVSASNIQSTDDEIGSWANRQAYIATFALVNKKPKHKKPDQFFFGRSRPEDAVSLLTEIRRGALWDSKSKTAPIKNAYSDLRKLKILGNRGSVELVTGEGNQSSSEIVRNRVVGSELITAAVNFLTEFPDAPAIDIGEIVQQQYGFSWNPKTKAAMGRRFRQWSMWMAPEIDKLVRNAAPNMNMLYSKFRSHDRRRRSVWTLEEWELASRLAQQGLSALQISRQISIGRTNIQNHLRALRSGEPFRFRVEPPSEQRPKKKRTVEK